MDETKADCENFINIYKIGNETREIKLENLKFQCIRLKVGQGHDVQKSWLVIKLIQIILY